MKHVFNFFLVVFTSFYCYGQDLPPAHDSNDSEILTSEYLLEIHIESDDGDYIGSGDVYHYNVNKPPLSAKNTCKGKKLTIEIDDWTLEFEGEIFEQRTYSYAQRIPFQEGKNPGMSISKNYKVCNRASGEFSIIDIVYNESNQIISLALDFIHFCGYHNNSLKGFIRYNSQIPISSSKSAIFANEHPLKISMYSPTNEWIGQGLNYLYMLNIHNSAPMFKCKSNTIYLTAGKYNFNFAAPKGELLSAGYYNNAERFEKDIPGMSISGDGRGCNEIIGDFNVLSIEYNENKFITTLAIDFAQYCCASRNGSPLLGSIRYNSKMPLTSEEDLLSKFNVHDNNTDFFDEDEYDDGNGDVDEFDEEDDYDDYDDYDEDDEFSDEERNLKKLKKNFKKMKKNFKKMKKNFLKMEWNLFDMD